jgi:hypothetical protein
MHSITSNFVFNYCFCSLITWIFVHKKP